MLTPPPNPLNDHPPISALIQAVRQCDRKFAEGDFSGHLIPTSPSLGIVDAEATAGVEQSGLRVVVSCRGVLSGVAYRVERVKKP